MDPVLQSHTFKKDDHDLFTFQVPGSMEINNLSWFDLSHKQATDITIRMAPIMASIIPSQITEHKNDMRLYTECADTTTEARPPKCLTFIDPLGRESLLSTAVRRTQEVISARILSTCMRLMQYINLKNTLKHSSERHAFEDADKAERARLTHLKDSKPMAIP